MSHGECMRAMLNRALGRRRYIALREAWYHYHSALRRSCELDDMDAEHYRRCLSNDQDPLLVASRNRIAAYRNRHAGQRCFILGNGPSLNSMDLSLLENEFTFGSNRIYLMQERNGFLPTYYVSVNPNVIRQFAQDIHALPMLKFLSYQAAGMCIPDKQTVFIRDTYERTLGFSYDVPRSVCEGATVTYCMLQIAFYMGFSKVCLIGVDHRFSVSGSPHQLVTAKSDDVNHFDPRYFGAGIEWQLPDLETSELAYQLAKYTFTRNRRVILDATVDGALTLFPKVSFDSLFAARSDARRGS